jgi:SpoIID/LytB domain protein
MDNHGAVRNASKNGGAVRIRLLAALGLVAATLVPTGAGAAVPVLVIDGRGFGHGVGMAQDGAFWMGKSGATLAQIVGQFYPGTKIGKSGGTVRVAVFTPTDGSAAVAFPNGGEIRDAPDGAQSAGFPVRVAAGGQVVLHWDGSRYSVEGGSPTARTASSSDAPASSRQGAQIDPTQLPGTTTTLPDPTSSTSSTTTTAPPPSSSTTSTTAPPKASGVTSGRSLWAVPSGGGTTSVPARGRRYRGLVEATAGRGPFHLVNQVDVEQYLRGMGEVRNPSWPAASLRAQALAARTYALRAMAANGELCDDQRCQVYLGQQAEYGAMDKAVSGTAGQVLLFGKSLASTVYSANGGAFSASRQEGFGTPDDGGYPYLRPAPYPTQDPLPWTVRVALSDVGARLGYKGALSGVAVGQKGPSGRALSVTLQGATGEKAVPGLGFARAFSLKSTLFSVRVESADSAPAPPPSGSALQAPPEDAGPVFDPNALPPDPLSADELIRAVPPAALFTPAPEAAPISRPQNSGGHGSLWLAVAAVLFAAAAAAASYAGRSWWWRRTR